MSRKIFLSFLGTSDYEPVNYYIKDKPPLPAAEKYVQKTILDQLVSQFTQTDRAFIFLTDEARKANWNDNGHTDRKTKEVIPNTGLARQIEAATYPFPVDSVSVSSESETSAIWKTFEQLYDCLEQDDEVYLDITHSWRYLPMLGMTLLNYAKVLKNIQVKSIYYGAFEQLGSNLEVTIMPPQSRPVPILDLVRFSDVQDWTIAADDFVLDGNPNRLQQLTKRNLSPVLSASQGQDEEAKNLKKITDRLVQLVDLIKTNRGLDIWDFNFQELQELLGEFSKETSHIKAFNGVFQHIEEKVNSFRLEDHLQWLDAAGWCLKHGLVQQGITQLQEGLVSWLCDRYEAKSWEQPGFFNKEINGAGRDLITKTLRVIAQKTEEGSWSGIVKEKANLTHLIKQDALAKSLAKPFSALLDARNDINHGGYIAEKKQKAKSFYKTLKKSHKEIRQILEQYSVRQPSEPLNLGNQPNGLLNLSNHPSERWLEDQMRVATEAYGTVTDLAFPHIDPGMSSKALKQLVADYYQKIQTINPKVVHLMGEMTFTYALVQKLQRAGIPCVASTSERLVTEGPAGEKVVRFRFVQFRDYA